LVGPKGADRRVGRGEYDLPELSEFNGQACGSGETTAPVSAPTVPVAAAPIQTIEAAGTTVAPANNFALANGEGLVPERIGTYVPFGHFKDVERIAKSKTFFPVFVTGLSGNGKTCMVEQVCAKLKRELFRVNITIETDEDDLLGGFRLIDGNTVWQDGPVVQAMKTGAVLLLDEVDLASSKAMCLQPVLEGKGVFLKKINQWVTPADGFTIFATANTKGKGDESGVFVGTNVLNEAFLDRFSATFEQEYPSRAQEKKMLTKRLAVHNIKDADFVDNLCKWAEIVRKSYYEDAVDEIITTRRLINVCEAYAIFGDKSKSIDLSLARFDSDTKEAFLSLYGKIDADVDVSVTATDENGNKLDTKCPF
jgi:midasin (ATPase involved in ribosome maturation)